jgi:Protein of unknown function (DUF2585)
MRDMAMRHWLTAGAVLGLALAILLGMGRPPICTCGTIKLWEGVVQSAGNSQHLSDWYSFSHLIHGFLFFALYWLVLRPRPLGLGLVLAVVLEMAWEIVENSPMVIERYRAATMAVGYSGDSVLNSMSDGLMMVAGFVLASRLPWKATVALALLFEAFTALVIRDNLALNILMLVAPSDAVRAWQAGT